MPTLEDYRNNSGDFAEPTAEVHDADVPEQNDIPDQGDEPDFDDDKPNGDEQEYEDEYTAEPDAEDDPEPELSPKEKTAFEKRMERERRKLEEELSKQFDEKYSKHKSVIEKLGGDPDQIVQHLENQRIQNEVQAQAQQLAYNNGWDEEQTQWYVNDQMERRRQQQQQNDLQKEIAQLRLESQINELRDNPDFTGIATMKKEIADIVSKSNGQLTVSQAYWALGGESRAKQMKREAEQRSAVQRRNRVVAKDTATAASTEKAIPASVLADAKRMGISESEIRELMSFDAKNINEYREKKRK
ncbi:hypothetical protein NKT34_13620 [Paenibacillus polysaccharolyticus]|uniref:hypothetical protein n=1 Tax=Paenibacillus polysaccharolyticus TaxID=582692 RepID=UPI00209DCB4E|nr:hypothetical protein [Paenibacillus polysaccharolyticus]MCP1134338.1 hypothetical protein [Paenibacillus polysaccharolyticus]